MIIVLKYCVGFCHTSTWISHRYTYVSSLLNLFPTSHPILPLRLSQSPGFEFLGHGGLLFFKYNNLRVLLNNLWIYSLDNLWIFYSHIALKKFFNLYLLGCIDSIEYMGSLTVACGLSCPGACRILVPWPGDQGSNQSLWHWKVDSSSSSSFFFFILLSGYNYCCCCCCFSIVFCTGL